MKLEMPEKPKTEKAKIDLIWDAVFNHLPHLIANIESFTSIRFKFVFAFMGLVLALLGVILGVIVLK